MKPGVENNPKMQLGKQPVNLSVLNITISNYITIGENAINGFYLNGRTGEKKLQTNGGLH